jgi:RNA polymerase sigma factor (sigma-70 family)
MGHMVNRPVHPLLSYLRRLHNDGGEGVLDDRQLLRRFLAERDEAAFSAILQRHGPLVWGVCARRLGETAEAEDAFQATFLVLIRKPPSLHGPHALGPWLYGVAWRTTCRIRRQRTHLAARERPLASQPAEPVAAEASQQMWLDVRPVIDEEVSRLPTRYRQAVLLCYLQGRSTEEAARLLGCARGTVFSRLSRGRDLLLQRLARRGLNVSAAVLTAGFAAEGAARAALTKSTLHLGLSFAAGTAGQGLSPTLAALVEGALRSMLLSKIKLVVIVLLVLGMAGSGVGLLAHHAAQGKPAPQANAATPAAKDKDKAEPPKAKPADGASEKEKPAQGNEQAQDGTVDGPVDAKLKAVVDFAGIDDPKATLVEALDAMRRHHGIAYVLNEKAFHQANLADMGKTEIAQPNPMPQIRAPLKTIYQAILDRASLATQSSEELMLVVRGDHLVEITTKTAVMQELHRDGGQLLPLVWEKFEETPISQVLESIAKSSGYNVVVDPQVKDKVQAKASAQLMNVPTDTAVRLLAAIADVSVVRMDNIFFLTTAEKANQLRQEQPQREEQPLKPQKKEPRKK